MLNNFFSQVDIINPDISQKFTIKFMVEQISLTYFQSAHMIEVEWTTSPKNDLIADSVALMILQINENPSPDILRMIEAVRADRINDDYGEKLKQLLEVKFEEVSMSAELCIKVSHRGQEAYVDLPSRQIKSSSDELRKIIKDIVEQLEEAYMSIDVSKF